MDPKEFFIIGKPDGTYSVAKVGKNPNLCGATYVGRFPETEIINLDNLTQACSYANSTNAGMNIGFARGINNFGYDLKSFGRFLWQFLYAGERVGRRATARV